MESNLLSRLDAGSAIVGIPSMLCEEMRLMSFTMALTAVLTSEDSDYFCRGASNPHISLRATSAKGRITAAADCWSLRSCRVGSNDGLGGLQSIVWLTGLRVYGP